MGGCPSLTALWRLSVYVILKKLAGIKGYLISPWTWKLKNFIIYLSTLFTPLNFQLLIFCYVLYLFCLLVYGRPCIYFIHFLIIWLILKFLPLFTLCAEWPILSKQIHWSYSLSASHIYSCSLAVESYAVY